MTPSDAIPVAVWLREDQVSLLSSVLNAANLRLVGAGGNGGRDLAKLHNAEDENDLRSMIATTDASLVIIGDPGPFADGSSTSDFRTLVDAGQRGVIIASLEPIPALSLHLTDPSWQDASDVAKERVAFIPLVRRGRALRRAHDLLGSFGPIEAVSIVTLGRSSEGSLGARLAGAADLLTILLGQPSTVLAAHTPGTDDPATPETLRGFRGHLAATFRFADGTSASLFASDRAAVWSRSVTLLGPGGRIVADDSRVDWYDASGSHVETMSSDHAIADTAAAVIADDIRALLGDAPRAAPVDLAGVLATGHAALLSARTGHAEQPAELRRLGGT
ncbi:MAG: hypothetical protein AAF937_05355 [Planctomycetota bacterium]